MRRANRCSCGFCFELVPDTATLSGGRSENFMLEFADYGHQCHCSRKVDSSQYHSTRENATAIMTWWYDSYARFWARHWAMEQRYGSEAAAYYREIITLRGFQSAGRCDRDAVALPPTPKRKEGRQALMARSGAAYEFS